MRHRSRQRYMADALTADLGIRDLDAAAVADDALISIGLELAAPALPGLGSTEDALAEETVPLRAERALVYGLRLLHLAI